MTSFSSHRSPKSSGSASSGGDTDIFAAANATTDKTKRWSIRNAKIIVPSAMMATVLVVGGGAATASAMFDKGGLAKPTDEQHAHMEQVMTDRDYDGWKSLMHAQIDSVTQEQFNAKADRFTERQTRKAEHKAEMESILREHGMSDEDIATLNELREAHDKEGLKALHEELGLDELKDQLKPEHGHKDGPRGDRDGKRGFGGPFGRS